MAIVGLISVLVMRNVGTDEALSQARDITRGAAFRLTAAQAPTGSPARWLPEPPSWLRPV